MQVDHQTYVEQLEEALSDLVNVEFWVPPEVDGDRYCIWCQSLIDYEGHQSGCAYVKAKTLIQ